jgi:hypothetical protein
MSFLSTECATAKASSAPEEGGDRNRALSMLRRTKDARKTGRATFISGFSLS